MDEKIPIETKSKERWDPKTREPVRVVEDEAYHARLEHLRSLSNELNKILEEKLEAAKLPFYSWNKSSKTNKDDGVIRPKVMRLAILLRPEFYQSSEVKNKQTRYNTGDDQLTYFFHLTADNHLQFLRLRNDASQTAYRIYFESSVFPNFDSDEHAKERGLVEDCVKRGDMNELANYVISRLSDSETAEDDLSYAQEMTRCFKNASALATVKQAKTYFADGKIFGYQSPEIIRNLGKAAIVSVLGMSLEFLIGATKDLKPEGAKETLVQQAEKILDLEVASYTTKAKLRDFIPDCQNYIQQVIQNLIKVYKPRMLGWDK